MNKRINIKINKQSSTLKKSTAFDPILVTDNALSIEGRQESKNSFLLVYNCPSVIDIILVAIYSVISLAMVSIIGNPVIEPFQ
jgi:hypothetical protein